MRLPLHCLKLKIAALYIKVCVRHAITAESLREAAKKVLLLMAGPLIGGGVKAFMARPLREELFFFCGFHKTTLDYAI